MIKIISHILSTTLALLVVDYLFEAVSVSGWHVALISAAVLGLLYTFVRPILTFLSLPVTILTLGLFTFVINGVLIWAAAEFITGFSVASLWWAIIAGILLSILTTITNFIFDKLFD